MDGEPLTEGVPLSHYRQHGADVEFICLGCARWWVRPLEDMISRYGDVGIVGLARRARGPCPECGEMKWETRPHFPPAQGTPGHVG